MKTNVKKAEELQGSTKIKKITVKDFKNETPKKKQVFKNDNNNISYYLMKELLLII